MTQEEIIERAELGGFAIVRGIIKVIDGIGGLHIDIGREGLAFVENKNVLAIEPPPKTDAETIAEQKARIVGLETFTAYPFSVMQAADKMIAELRAEIEALKAQNVEQESLLSYAVDILGRRLKTGGYVTTEATKSDPRYRLVDALVANAVAELDKAVAEPEAIMAQTVLTGKIPWFGGECPVPLDTKVRAYLRSGETWEAGAEFCNWGRFVAETDDTGWHIISYQVLT